MKSDTLDWIVILYMVAFVLISLIIAIGVATGMVKK